MRSREDARAALRDHAQAISKSRLRDVSPGRLLEMCPMLKHAPTKHRPLPIVSTDAEQRARDLAVAVTPAPDAETSSSPATLSPTSP